MTRAKPHFRLVGYEEEKLELYAMANEVVLEKEALKYAIEVLGATKEDFYKED